MSRATKILVIEDEPADFRLVERHLAKAGFMADLVRIDSSAALHAALDGSWDIVFLDYMVPNLPFESTLLQLQGGMPHTPIILLSGSVGEERAIDMMRMGVWDVVLKDNLARLIPTIDRCQREAMQRFMRAAAEAELRRNEARLSLAVEVAQIGVWEWSVRGDQTFWSPLCSRIIGRDLTGVSFPDFLSSMAPTDSSLVQQRIARAIAERLSFENEFRLRSAGRDDRWIACHGAPDGDDSDARVIGVLQDISARKKGERADAGDMTDASTPT